jgi:hypothetical protein
MRSETTCMGNNCEWDVSCSRSRCAVAQAAWYCIECGYVSCKECTKRLRCTTFEGDSTSMSTLVEYIPVLLLVGEYSLCGLEVSVHASSAMFRDIICATRRPHPPSPMLSSFTKPQQVYHEA